MEGHSMKTLKDLDRAESDVKEAQAKLAKQDKLMGKAQAELEKETAAQTKAQSELIQLIQQVHHLRNEEAQLSHDQSTKKLSRAEALLEEKIKDGHDEKECDDLRAKVITAKGKMQAVERAREKAQTGLDQCLATKARLKASLEEC